MDKTIHFTLPIKIGKLLALFLLMYPPEYRRKFGSDIAFLLSEMYEEEIRKNRKVGFVFWILQFGDITKSVIEQHILFMQKKGMKKYFEKVLHINRYNIIGGILLLPFGILFSLDFVGRLVQGDFIHYNRTWYAAITQSVLFREPVVMRAILIYAPLTAVLLNIIPLLSFIFSKKKITVHTLLLASPFAIVIIGLGLSFLSIVYGHDFVPCTVHSIISHGILQFPRVLTVCKNA